MTGSGRTTILISAAFLVLFSIAHGWVRPHLLWAPSTEFMVIERSWQQWGRLGFGLAADRKPLSAGGALRPAGMGTHANSIIVGILRRNGSKVRGSCGLTDLAAQNEKSSIMCVVRERGKELFRSELLNSARGTAAFSVPYPATGELELIIEDGNDGNNFDHAAWYDLEVVP